MTRLLIILLFLTVLFESCERKTNPYKKENKINTLSGFVYPVLYEDDNFQKLVNDSLHDGKWVGYYLDKKTVAFIGFYKNGKPNGIFQYYYKSGKIRHTCVYKEGIEYGPFTFWHKEGTISMIGYRKAGKDDGEWFDWWSNGNLRRHYFFKEGLQINEDCYYDSTGNLEWKGKYMGGFEVGVWNYYKNKKLIMTRKFVDSLTSKEYVLIKKYSKLNFPTGNWKTYYDNGILKEELIYSNYTLSKKIEYYPNTKIKTETNYIDVKNRENSLNSCVKNGNYISYFENGQIETKGQYELGEKNGEWIYFSANGNEIKRENYSLK
jgi:uncharacterized protein